VEQFAYTGELAALIAAFLWAASSTIYALLGQRIPPLKLNFVKGLIAIALICLTLLVTSQPVPQILPLPVGVLFLSGILGIGLGDTAYFVALNHLGARRALLLETLAPPMTAILALIFLEENLGVIDWCGILLTLLGVAIVISDRTPDAVVNSANPQKGIIWGILAAIAQASGSVLSRYALVISNLSPLWSSLIRILAGVAIVYLLLIRQNSQQKGVSILWTKKAIAAIAIAAFAGTYLGIWLQQTSLKYAPAGIAQTLLATSPLFILPIAFCLGEKINLRAVLGVAIAIAGIAVLFGF
jgi:drug/metabolite transporter (DMT)-like permease